MGFIDRQRVEAVRFLETRGYTFEDGSWKPPARVTRFTT
jgi:hypothetical protein